MAAGQGIAPTSWSVTLAVSNVSDCPPHANHRNDKHCICDRGFVCHHSDARFAGHCFAEYISGGGATSTATRSGFRHRKCPGCTCKFKGRAVAALSSEKRRLGRPDPLPMLSDLIDEESLAVTADVSWMLDFAIVGFPKCGTSWTSRYLYYNSLDLAGQSRLTSPSERQTYLQTTSPSVEAAYAGTQLWVSTHEYHCMGQEGSAAKLAQLLYEPHRVDAESNDNRRRWTGIKGAPRTLEGHAKVAQCQREALSEYAEHFPRTDFIICLRHPVLWFESYFNFHQRAVYPEVLDRPTSNLIRDCRNGVCTGGANFHFYLSRLGKTAMNTNAEMALLQHNMSIVRMPNRLFLQEIRQITHGHPAAANYTADLQHFLGLPVPLTPLEPGTQGTEHIRQLKEHKAGIDAITPHMINICDAEHNLVRQELVRIGRDASTWIVDYLLGSPCVVVSNRPSLSS